MFERVLNSAAAFLYFQVSGCFPASAHLQLLELPENFGRLYSLGNAAGKFRVGWVLYLQVYSFLYNLDAIYVGMGGVIYGPCQYPEKPRKAMPIPRKAPKRVPRTTFSPYNLRTIYVGDIYGPFCRSLLGSFPKIKKCHEHI